MKDNEMLKVTKLNMKENIVSQVAKEINDSMLYFKNKDFAVFDRRENNGFISDFAEALLEYIPGVILIERFYKSKGLLEKESKIKPFPQEERIIAKDFIAFSEKIKERSDYLEDEKTEIENKIKDFEKKLKEASSEKPANVFFKNDRKLISFSDIPDDTLLNHSEVYAAFLINSIPFFSWKFPGGFAFSLIKYDRGKFVDFLFAPLSGIKNV